MNLEDKIFVGEKLEMNTDIRDYLVSVHKEYLIQPNTYVPDDIFKSWSKWILNK
jgi:hypothetical protein